MNIKDFGNKSFISKTAILIILSIFGISISIGLGFLAIYLAEINETTKHGSMLMAVTGIFSILGIASTIAVFIVSMIGFGRALYSIYDPKILN